MLLFAHVAGALAAVMVFVGRRYSFASSFQFFQTLIGLLGPPRHAQKCCNHEPRNVA